MSKGEIVSGGTDGLYTVKLTYASERVEAELAQINERIAEVAVEIPNKKLEVIAAVDVSDSLIRDIDLLIPDYRENPEQFADQIRNLQIQLVAQRGQIARLTISRDTLIAENLSLLKKRGQLESAPSDEIIEAWCADYTETLSGIVGLADINDQGGQGFLVQPGFADDAQYIPSRDGALFPNIAQSGPQIYFNTAILPGVQKWRPRYRIGVISLLDGDSCSVELDDAFSSVLGLNINAQTNYSGVPIQYMDCNGAAFEDGDRVLVAFTQSGPVVIGFEKEPTPCQLLRFAFEPSQYTKPSSNVLRTFWGQPFDNGVSEINPPLGTEFGANPVWAAAPVDNSLLVTKGNPLNYGNRNWISKTKTVLSWEGPPARVFDNTRIFFNPGIGWPHPQWQERFYTSTVVYKEFQVIIDLTEHAAAAACSEVHGAAIYEDLNEQKWLYVIASPIFFAAGQRYKAFRITVDADLQPFGILEEVAEFVPEAEMGHVSHWYFSEDGQKAVCTLRNFEAPGNHTKYQLARFNVVGGFSFEEIYNRIDSSIGQEQEAFERQVTTGPIRGEVQTYASESLTETHLQPIYCEMIKDQEVIVYHRIPGRSSTNDYTYEIYINDNTGANYLESTQTITLEQLESEAIVTSQGKVIFEIPKTESRTMSVYLKDDRAAEAITASRNETEAFGGFSLSYGTLALDARFDFALVAYSFVDQNFLIPQATVSYIDPNDSNPSAVFPTTGTGESTDTLCAMLKGSKIFETALEERPPANINDVTYFRSSVQPSPNVDPTGTIEGTISETSPIGESPPYVVGNPNTLLDAAGFYSGKYTFGAAAIRDSLNSRDSYEVFSLLSEYNDVIADLVERSDDDCYVLHRPGIW
jgi:hypothetical protein